MRERIRRSSSRAGTSAAGVDAPPTDHPKYRRAAVPGYWGSRDGAVEQAGPATGGVAGPAQQRNFRPHNESPCTDEPNARLRLSGRLGKPDRPSSGPSPSTAFDGLGPRTNWMPGTNRMPSNQPGAGEPTACPRTTRMLGAAVPGNSGSRIACRAGRAVAGGASGSALGLRT